MTDPAPLPIGDIALFDNDVPPLTGGSYWITTTHTLLEGTTPVNTDLLQATQEIVIVGPQFTVSPSDIISCHPADGSSGMFGEQLAHVVFAEPALPWERTIDGPAGTNQPWLALLVLTDDELIGASDSTTRATAITIADFLSQDLGAWKPTLTPDVNLDTTQGCRYIQISTDLFTAVTPRLDELRYLAHCRQSNIGDKAAQDLDPNGLVSVVFANRFPATPAAGVPAVRNIAHLVSIEGFESVLTDAPAFGGQTSVVMLSLASWTFQCLPNNASDFRGLVNGLIASEQTSTGSVDPDALWLRLPPASVPAATDATTGSEVAQRLEDGFVPLAYHLRTGEDTFAWYRGPLTPVLPSPVVKAGPFLSSDAALAFQNSFGVFDASLAAAWQAGRAAALSDRSFGQKLYDYRCRTHRVTDQLLARLQSAAFLSQNDINTLSTETTVQDEFIGILDATLLDTIASAATTPATTPSQPSPPRTSPDPRAAVQAFLADPAVLSTIAGIVAGDLTTLAEWLAGLLLLYPVPFNLLVPDPRMLPAESIRFFYVDNNWTGALLDGAISLGLESSRQTFFCEVTHGLLHEAATDAALRMRQSLTGVDSPASESAQNLMSGLLLRSSLVSGWPTLAVRPSQSDGTLLRILRMDRLSPSVLLCLFWGVPDHVEISEPQESFAFGVDDDGCVTLRNLVAPAAATGPALGAQLGAALPIYDPTGVQQLGVRRAGSRALNLSPDSATGVLQTVATALVNASGATAAALGPAAFGLQMVKAPESVVFACQST